MAVNMFQQKAMFLQNVMDMLYTRLKTIYRPEVES